MCPSRISDNPEEIKTKIDFAWEKIFSELNVLEKIEFDDYTEDFALTKPCIR